MELLEGLTLRHMTAGKPLEIETVLDPGIQIADALDAARVHHRDDLQQPIRVGEERARGGRV